MSAGLFCLAGGYLLGSIPFGLLVARLFAGVDVRRVGSGNIGATNVSRAAGAGAGALTLALDAAKGSLPVLAAASLLGTAGPGGDAWPAAAGFAAFLGHVFPPWLRFRGGKGVATALGVTLALAPWAALVGLSTFAAVLAATRIVSAGSLAGSAAAAAALATAHGAGSPASLAGLAMSASIWIRHRGNVARLLRGEERRIGR